MTCTSPPETTAAALQPIADIYIRLMQMTVLPYLLLTLIIGLGRMDAAEARRLAVRGSLLLLFFWAVAPRLVASLLLAFMILPLAVAARTPFTHREVISVSRDALLTAFVANSVFILMPMLVEHANALMEKRRVKSPEATSTADVRLPMAFTFPKAGKLLTLLFVPHAAWLSGNPLEQEGHGALFGTGIFAYFAKAQWRRPSSWIWSACPRITSGRTSRSPSSPGSSNRWCRP